MNDVFEDTAVHSMSATGWTAIDRAEDEAEDKIIEAQMEEGTLPYEDPINPRHYKEHPSGIECISVTEHMNFCLGNAVKYLWRYKSEEDLHKAIWYIKREIERARTHGIQGKS